MVSTSTRKGGQMKDYTFTVTVSCDTGDRAVLVMQERICFEEDYGFDYTISYEGGNG